MKPHVIHCIFGLLGVAGALAGSAGCDSAGAGASACAATSDCSSGAACVDGRCVVVGAGDANGVEPTESTDGAPSDGPSSTPDGGEDVAVDATDAGFGDAYVEDGDAYVEDGDAYVEDGDADAADALDAPDVPTDGGPSAAEAWTVYAVAGGRTLYRIDATTLEPTRVGDLTCNYLVDSELRVESRITEIALSSSGTLFALGASGIYQIETTWFYCSMLRQAEPGAIRFTGLASFTDDAEDSDGERLLALGWNAAYEIDPTSGSPSLLGAYGIDPPEEWMDPLEVTGHDAAWVPSAGQLLASVTAPIWDSEGTNLVQKSAMASLDPYSGAATLLGGWSDTATTGTPTGLAVAGDALYGFMGSGAIVRIDPTTGALTDVRSTDIAWRGAASARLGAL